MSLHASGKAIPVVHCHRQPLCDQLKHTRPPTYFTWQLILGVASGLTHRVLIL